MVFFLFFLVIPQPVYMNSEELQRLSAAAASNSENNNNSVAGSTNANGTECLEDDLKTPTVEELSFPGQKAVSRLGDNFVISLI